MAHPDDAELYAGGTIARLLAQGLEVRIVKTTAGDRGSRQEKISQQDLKELRLKEDQAAMQELGIDPSNSVNLEFEDGRVENSHETISGLAQQIRLFQPDLIITHNSEDVIIRFQAGVSWVNHRDHRNTGLSAIDAAYPYSRDLLFFPEQLEGNATSHTCTEFLLVDYYDHPDVVCIDVTEFLAKRISAHAKHASQYPLTKAQESADFFTKFEGVARRYERFRYVLTD